MKIASLNKKHKIPEKANRILNGVLVIILLILIRIWHLSVLQHQEKLEESRKPQEKVVIERANRATICDRFHIPMAVNKVQYNAAIAYGGISDLPRIVFKKNFEGKRVKNFYRRDYIKALSEKLSEELHLDPERIEDLIHSKAAILGNVPCILKEDISEEEYFRLKMLEKDWPGLYAEIAPKRYYPMGPVGGDVVGYIGPISAIEYKEITQELHELRESIMMWKEGDHSPFPQEYQTVEEVQQRLKQLEKKAYTINDFVGKMGVEAVFDEQLRGFRGRHRYLVDTRGNFLRELMGSESSIPGQPVILSISSELQAYAEQLLVEYDQELPSTRPASIKRQALIPEHQPWIKGGAIVVMDPHSGEIYALASSPRFDPNDFIRTGDIIKSAEKNRKIHQWLETEAHIASLWDLKSSLIRDRFNQISQTFYQEEIKLDWNTYLGMILPAHSPVRQRLDLKGTINDAIWVQKKVCELISLFETENFSITPAKIFDVVYDGENHISTYTNISLQERAFFADKMVLFKPQIDEICSSLDSYFHGIPLNYEKLLLVDLYRINVDPSDFSASLKEAIGKMSLVDYRKSSAQISSVEEAMYQIIEELYYHYDFKNWREKEFKSFLKKKRLEEKKMGRKYSRPYIEYLDKVRKEQFAIFWEKYRWDFLSIFLNQETHVNNLSLKPYVLDLMHWAHEIAQGAYSGLTWIFDYHRFKEQVDSFASHDLFLSFCQSLRSFNKLNRPLFGSYLGLRGSLEKHLASAFYPTYGFGYARSYAFRQATTVGSIFKLVTAYESMRQRYFIHPEDLNPLTIIDNKHRAPGKIGEWNVGYNLDGSTIPVYYRGGRLPRSEHHGIGEVDLVHAIETSSNPYFAMLAGDVLEDPEDLCSASQLFGYGSRTGIGLPGEYAGKIPKDVAYNRTGLYAMSIGQHSLVGTPLQTAVMMAGIANGGEILKPQITHCKKDVKWRIFLPKTIQKPLLQGLRQVVLGEKGTARLLKHQFPAELVNRIIGKTSTSEVMERYGLDSISRTLKSKDIWFGAIAYESPDYLKPELVVIIYLRQGEFGKDAAPLAGKIIQKWMSIKASHQSDKDIS
ncbi:MAG: penicillin-binding transpeptidase domain-containing protein [Chlamydiales bacterium]